MSIASSCHRFGLRPEEGAGCVGEGSPKAVGAARLATGQQREGMWLGELPCRAVPCRAMPPTPTLPARSPIYTGDRELGQGGCPG